MKHPRRRLNWVRVTRDPAVAAAHERSVEASANWTQALIAALRRPAEESAAPIVFPNGKLIQAKLPFGLDQAAS
ncbi:MAG TPA: hypothetical protein VII06_36220 [Chloroflexota bacterium]|jgi:hypothetical protein